MSMSNHFDLVLGDDWCETYSRESSFKTHNLKCDDTDGHTTYSSYCWTYIVPNCQCRLYATEFAAGRYML